MHPRITGFSRIGNVLASESQKVLARYQQDSRLSAIFLIAFGVSIFAAIAISPK
ncbi:MAG: hypothetical protein ACJAVK_003522 [Akkermansiaceae bacterium]